MRILGLRSRFFILLGILVAVNLAGALTTLWYVQRTQALFFRTIEQGAEALATAQELQNALLSQRGYVSYYYLDHDADWLERLEDAKKDFEIWWRKSFDLVRKEEDSHLLFTIESEYVRYTVQRDRVIELYKEGKRLQGEALHADVRKKFQMVSELCARFTKNKKQRISELLAEFNKQFARFTWLAWSAIPAGAILGLMLAVLIIRKVLSPLHRITETLSSHVDHTVRDTVGPDEVEYLGDKVQLLLKDVDQARHSLAKSREDLLQAEKLATTGKLAAGVAHSVRNPLTSVKMRLFTLGRSLPANPEVQEDLEVINEEIDFIDTILRNFLEFSRPPKLKPQPLCPSDIVDQSLQLLKHKLESTRTEVTVQRETALPLVLGDPDQLKEVLVNLLVNAMEAMGDNGSILIAEEKGVIEPYGHVIILRMTDSGPGMSPSLLAQAFEPFVSNKEEGTGLGLAISRRIMEEHGGWLHATSETGKGATFVIGLPQMEKCQ